MPAVPQQNVDLPDCQENWEWVQKFISPKAVTAMPATELFEGREVTYAADAANGVYWQFKRVNGVWVFIGGAPLQNQDLTLQTVSFSANIFTSWSPNITITLPLAGDYEIRVDDSVVNDVSAASWVRGLRINGTDPASTTDRTVIHTSTVAGNWVNLHSSLLLVGAAAATVLVVVWLHNGTNPSSSRRLNAQITATPVKLT